MTALFSSRKRARLSNSDMRDDTNTSPPEEKLNSIAESNVSVDDLVTQPIKHEKKCNKKKKEVIPKRLKNLCKKLKLRLTITRNGKRYPKSKKVLEKH